MLCVCVDWLLVCVYTCECKSSCCSGLCLGTPVIINIHPYNPSDTRGKPSKQEKKAEPRGDKKRKYAKKAVEIHKSKKPKTNTTEGTKTGTPAHIR